MIVAIIVVSVVLSALFIVAAIAGNRAQTRMVEKERVRETGARGAEPPVS